MGFEIFPLDVFDQSHLSLGEAVDITHDGRDFGQTGEFRRPPAAFAGDQLEAVFHTSEHERLNDSRMI